MGNNNCGCGSSASYLQTIIKLLCSLGSQVNTAFNWILGTASITRYDVSTTGSIAAGAISVSFLNTGGADGVVLGEPIVVGQAINIDSPSDPVNHVFKTLPEITYDGTGTTLSITVLS